MAPASACDAATSEEEDEDEDFFVEEVAEGQDLDYSSIKAYGPSADAPKPMEVSLVHSTPTQSLRPVTSPACPANTDPFPLRPQAHSMLPSTAQGPTSGRRPRARPASAVSDNTSRAKQRLHTLPVRKWGPVDVGLWVQEIGMGQYRKHFVHNAVTGTLLLALDLEIMRSELKISPLGHRAAILEAMQALGPQPDESCRSSIRHGGIQKAPRPHSAPAPHPRRPANENGVLPGDSHLGPAAGKVTVYESLKRLSYSLGRAEERARHADAMREDMERKARLYADNVRRVKGELIALRKGNRMKLQSTWSPCNHSDGRVPWLHTGACTQTRKVHPQCHGSAGDDPLVEETFKPRLEGSASARAKRAEVGALPFEQRLASAQKQRAAEMQALTARCHAPRSVEEGTKLAARQLATVRQFISTVAGVDLSQDSVERSEKLDELLEDSRVQESLQLSHETVEKLKQKRGQSKVGALAVLIGTQSFLSRLTTKSRRGPMVKARQPLPNPAGKLPAEVKLAESKAALQLAVCLGWAQDTDRVDAAAAGCTEHIQAVFLRAQTIYLGLKHARDSGRPFAPNWAAMERESPVQAEIGRLMAARLEGQRAADPEAQPVDVLERSAKLLAGLTELEQASYMAPAFQEKSPVEQLRLFYRAVRGQEFLSRQRNAVDEHERWIHAEAARYAPPRISTSHESQESFFSRLMADGERRKAAHTSALAEKLAKEQAILKNSKLWCLSHKLCRRCN